MPVLTPRNARLLNCVAAPLGFGLVKTLMQHGAGRPLTRCAVVHPAVPTTAAQASVARAPLRRGHGTVHAGWLALRAWRAHLGRRPLLRSSRSYSCRQASAR